MTKKEYISDLKSKGVKNETITSVLHHIKLWDKNRLKKDSKKTKVIASYHNSCIQESLSKNRPLSSKEKRMVYLKALKKFK